VNLRLEAGSANLEVRASPPRPRGGSRRRV